MIQVQIWQPPSLVIALVEMGKVKLLFLHIKVFHFGGSIQQDSWNVIRDDRSFFFPPKRTTILSDVSCSQALFPIPDIPAPLTLLLSEFWDP